MIVTQGYNEEYDFWPRTLESALFTASKKNVEKYNQNKLLRDDISTTLANSPMSINLVEKKLLSSSVKKADFALKSLDLISDDDFKVPEYLLRGLEWLKEND